MVLALNVLSHACRSLEPLLSAVDLIFMLFVAKSLEYQIYFLMNQKNNRCIY